MQGNIREYKSIFITARPGMGASTLAVNIISELVGALSRVMVLSRENGWVPNYGERMAILGGVSSFWEMRRAILDSRMSANPSLVLLPLEVAMLSPENILEHLEKYSCDTLVICDAYGEISTRQICRVAKKLRETGRRFVLVTRILRRCVPFTGRERNTPVCSRHRAALRHFDLVLVPYREGYYRDEKPDEDCGEIRVYKRGARTYSVVSVLFDFDKQKISIK